MMTQMNLKHKLHEYVPQNIRRHALGWNMKLCFQWLCYANFCTLEYFPSLRIPVGNWRFSRLMPVQHEHPLGQTCRTHADER